MVNGRLLVDGMLAHSLPTRPVRDMGADRVIAVSLRSRWSEAGGPKHIFDVIGQCFSIAQDMNCVQAKQCADFVIEPDVTGYRYDDFERSSELVALGESVTRAALPEIRKWLEIATTDRAPGKRAASQPGIVSPALNAVAQK
jgi:NTE family protein